MWQLFTAQARRIILLAQTQAIELKSSSVAPEHLLLAIICEANNEAVEILHNLGISLEQILAEIQQDLEPENATSMVEPQLTPKTKRVLELAADDARRIGHDTISTANILTALAMGDRETTSKVLKRLGVDLAQIRQGVKEYFETHSPEAEEEVIPERTSLPEIPPHVAEFMNQFFSEEVRTVILAAAIEANVAHHKSIGIDHLILALLRAEDADVLRGKPLRFG